MAILYVLQQTILKPGKNNEQNPLQWDIYLHNRQSTISWVNYMFIKRLMKTVWLEFVSNKQNFEQLYIARYKNPLQKLFLFMQGAWQENIRFQIYPCLIKIVEFCGYQSFQN